MVLLNDTSIKTPLAKNSYLKRTFSWMVCGWGMGCQKQGINVFEWKS